MNKLKHWQDVVNLLIGVWLLISPWAMGLQDQGTITANFVIVGLALIALTLGALFVPKAWEEWSACAAGLWLVASPWLLDFASHLNATRNALAAGAAVVLMCVWSLMAYEEFSLWRPPTLR
ncbi:MAG: SPW repeat protein [Burkholderiales bacterium]